MAVIKKFYTVKEVSDKLGVTPKTILSWIHSGTISASKVGKKIYLIYEDQLVAFMQKNNFI